MLELICRARVPAQHQITFLKRLSETLFPLRKTHCFKLEMSAIFPPPFFPNQTCAPLCLLTSLMSIRDAMVRRVLGEKWLVIMILMPASEKDSWWGYADSSSSTISTDGFLWWFAVGNTQ